MTDFLASRRKVGRTVGIALVVAAAVLMTAWLFADAPRWIYGLSVWLGLPGIALVAATSTGRERSL